MTIKKLQNGSDIRGVAMDTVTNEPVNLNKNETIMLTYGFCTWLANKTHISLDKLVVAVGTDSRLSGTKLKTYILQTLNCLGIKAFDCGMASTPAMFMSTIFDEFKCDGSIMVTASHLPSNRNGFKYFDKNGGLNKSDIAEIIDIAENIQDNKTLNMINKINDIDIAENSNICNCNNITKANLIDIYASHLRNIICKQISNGIKINNIDTIDYDPNFPLAGLHVVVDAGNGAGGFYATKVLQPLGADITGSQFLEPDGNFPNHIPNPENSEAMQSICQTVKQYKADLGLIFDTDVDRASAVDEKGSPIARNEIVALAASLIAIDYPNSTVVTDSITSTHLTDFIETKLQLKHLRYKRGYKNVINKSIELNENNIDSQLAIETSGHAAFKENYFLDDGAYLATKIVVKNALLKMQGLKISSLLNDLTKPAISKEYRIAIKAKDFAIYGDKVLEKLQKTIQQMQNISTSSNCNKCGSTRRKADIELVTPNYEGVRISFAINCGNGWALLRKSLHDPIMPLNIESDDDDGVMIILSILKPILNEFEQLDLSIFDM